MFAALVVINFAGPEVTVDAGRDVVVEVIVSTVLAVKYVPVYRDRMRKKGFERKKV